MIIDSSALLSILFDKEVAIALLKKIAESKFRYVGAPTWVELAIVAKSRLGPEVLLHLDRLKDSLNLTILNFTAAHAEAAKSAYLNFGKGQGHVAQLNFGVCLCYAFAKIEAMPLLFKGEDFRHTDVE
jgi:ribonuclease VapC